MLVTERQLRRIIEKSILEHSRQKDFQIMAEQAKRSKVLVSTNRGTGYLTFGSLLEGIDRGEVSSRQMGIILENDLRSIRREILQEGLLDMAASAYESVKDGAIKLKDKISDAAASAMEKLNEKYWEWTTKLWMMMQKGKEFALKGVGLIVKAVDKIERFKKKHPILYKIIVSIMVMMVLFAIILITAKAAHAGIEAPHSSGKGTVQMNDKYYNLTLGALKKLHMKSNDLDEMNRLMEAMQAMEKAYKAKEAVDIGTLDKVIQGEYTRLVDIINIAKKAHAAGDKEVAVKAVRLLRRLNSIADQVYNTTNQHGQQLSMPVSIK